MQPGTNTALHLWHRMKPFSSIVFLVCFMQLGHATTESTLIRSSLTFSGTMGKTGCVECKSEITCKSCLLYNKSISIVSSVAVDSLQNFSIASALLISLFISISFFNPVSGVFGLAPQAVSELPSYNLTSVSSRATSPSFQS